MPSFGWVAKICLKPDVFNGINVDLYCLSVRILKDWWFAGPLLVARNSSFVLKYVVIVRLVAPLASIRRPEKISML